MTHQVVLQVVFTQKHKLHSSITRLGPNWTCGGYMKGIFWLNKWLESWFDSPKLIIHPDTSYIVSWCMEHGAITVFLDSLRRWRWQKGQLIDLTATPQVKTICGRHVIYGRSLVVRGEGDELCEGWCQVDGHQDHRVEARDPAAEARPGNILYAYVLQ